MPAPGSPEAKSLCLSDGRHVALISLWLNERRVVLLIERQVVDALAARTSDVALDPRVVSERELLLDRDLELARELVRALG